MHRLSVFESRSLLQDPEVLLILVIGSEIKVDEIIIFRGKFWAILPLQKRGFSSCWRFSLESIVKWYCLPRLLKETKKLHIAFNWLILSPSCRHTHIDVHLSILKVIALFESREDYDFLCNMNHKRNLEFITVPYFHIKPFGVQKQDPHYCIFWCRCLKEM